MTEMGPEARPRAFGEEQPAEEPTRASGRWAWGWRAWLLSFVLMLPATIPYLVHFGAVPYRGIPTGFLVVDMPYYLANAREHFDSGRFHLLYGNPFSPHDDTPRIYFQPLTLLLGSVWHFTQWEPGLVFLGFGFLAAWVCSRIAMALFEAIVGLKSRSQWLGLLVFSWGGGILIVSGTIHNLWTEGHLFNLFVFDPSWGFWFLNYGRNLIFPTEAFYHALFFGCILSIWKRRYGLAIVLAAALSISHPFTGIELLAILCAWTTFERVFMRNQELPRSFLLMSWVLLAAHLAYYLGYLRTSEEHRILMEQWAFDWVLPAKSYVPAYGVLFLLALWQVRRIDLWRRYFEDARHRLLLFWLIVAFALAKHEVFFRPIQPIHFTRGYIWTALFFLGSGTLIALIGFLRTRPGRAWKVPCLGVFLALMLSDNATFLGEFYVSNVREQVYPGFLLDAEMKTLFRWLDAEENQGHLVLSRRINTNYLITVYTPLRVWAGHASNTPHFDQRVQELADLFRHGKVIDHWRERPLLIIFEGSFPGGAPPEWLEELGAELVYKNATYQVYRYDPKALSRAP